MATEKRLIDANAAIKEMNAVEIHFWEDAEDGVEKCVNLLHNAPTVDAVEVPCKIGDRVWAIRSFKGVKHPQDGIVGEMFFTKDMKLHIVVKYVARGEWGKTVFASREEAEAALAERRTDNA